MILNEAIAVGVGNFFDTGSACWRELEGKFCTLADISYGGTYRCVKIGYTGLLILKDILEKC